MRTRRALTAGILTALLALAGVACEDGGATDGGAEPGGDADAAEPGDETGDYAGALPDDTEMGDPTRG